MLRYGLVGLGVAAIGAGVAANSGPLLDPACRFVAGRVEAASPHPLSITFDGVEGTLLFPRTALKVTNLSVARTCEGAAKDVAASFDLQMGSVRVEASPGPHIRVLEVDDVSGWVETAPNSPPLPHVVIDRVKLGGMGASLLVRSHAQPHPLPVVVRAAEAAGLDIGDPKSLLRPGSSVRASGTVDGSASFDLESTGGAAVKVAIARLPVARLAVLAPPGNVLEWLNAGTVDFGLVVGDARVSGSAHFAHLAAGIPESRKALLSTSRLILAGSVITFINSRSAPISLTFGYTLTPSGGTVVQQGIAALEDALIAKVQAKTLSLFS